MSTGSPGEQYGSTLVLTLVTGQMVTLNTTHTRIGARWLSEAEGLETLEWILSAGNGQRPEAGSGCIVEVDDAGHPLRFFPAHAIVVARIDPSYPLSQEP
ncbi:MAG TPA: hypothetical protein VH599_21380 [Ktedonobacterales bacterium]|jgi:hypothetical protein